MSETSTLGLILTFAGICVVTLGAFAGVWVQTKVRSDRTDAALAAVGIDAGTAASESTSAAEFAKPVSNGFTNEMRAGLAAIQREQSVAAKQAAEDRAVTRQALELISRHLGDHASADVRRGEG